MGDDMETLIQELEQRTEYVITLLRTQGQDIDVDHGKNAFAFVLGRDSDNAVVVEGTVSGDGQEANVTVWAMRDGARADVSTLEIDGQIFHSLTLI